MDIGALLEKAYVTAVGLSVLVGILGFVIYRNSWRWRQLAKAYPLPTSEAPARRRWINLMLDGVNPAWNNYSGIAVVGVNDRGVFLSILPPFSLFHKPLFFRHEDADFVETRWLFQNACAIELRKSGGIRIIINRETQRWIEEERAGPNIASGQRRPRRALGGG